MSPACSWRACFFKVPAGQTVCGILKGRGRGQGGGDGEVKTNEGFDRTREAEGMDS